MAHKVTVNKNGTELPNGYAYDTGAQVTLTDKEFAQIPAAAFTGGSPYLTDNGAVPNSGDNVYTQGAAVTAPVAITSVVAAGANPTKAEYDALRTDVVNLRTTVAALVTALTGTGKPLSS